MILLFATGVALTGFALSCIAIGTYRLVDAIGLRRGWWQ